MNDVEQEKKQNPARFSIPEICVQHYRKRKMNNADIKQRVLKLIRDDERNMAALDRMRAKQKIEEQKERLHDGY